MKEIKSWKDMMTRLPHLTEQELQFAINFEVSTYKRKAVIGRLHARYSKLRSAREREMLVKGEMLL